MGEAMSALVPKYGCTGGPTYQEIWGEEPKVFSERGMIIFEEAGNVTPEMYEYLAKTQPMTKEDIRRRRVEGLWIHLIETRPRIDNG